MFTDLNINSINNKKDHISEKYIFIEKKVKKKLIGSDLEQDPDPNPDPLFHETDPRIRIRIHIKMKRIRNTDKNCTRYQWCKKSQGVSYAKAACISGMSGLVILLLFVDGGREGRERAEGEVLPLLRRRVRLREGQHYTSQVPVLVVVPMHHYFLEQG